MAENKLSHIIQIDGNEYSITAEKVLNKLTINTVRDGVVDQTVVFDGSEGKKLDIEIGKAGVADEADYAENAGHAETAGNATTADKVKNALKIKDTAGKELVDFDGSSPAEFSLEAVENANTIRVNMDNNQKVYAAITISKEEPDQGSVGDIWFKY
jgi:hypothetical protein